MSNYFKTHQISQSCLTVFNHIAVQAGAEKIKAYVVGGFVRDLLLQHEVADIDIVVEGDAIAFARHFRNKFGGSKVVSYGRFGTAMLNFQHFKLEFASAREEYYEADSRKPQVKKTDIATDLSRRDFTINAMAISLNEEDWGSLIDPFQGQNDLDKKIIRTPLEPEVTYFDDPLRMLRAVRFASRLNFQIQPDSLKAILKMGHRMEIISQERITDELQKMLQQKNPSRALKLLAETKLLPVVLPDVYQLSQTAVFGLSAISIIRKALDYLVENKLEGLILRFGILFSFLEFSDEMQLLRGNKNRDGFKVFIKIGRQMKLPVKMIEKIAKTIENLHYLRVIVFGENPFDRIKFRTMLIDLGSDMMDILNAATAIHFALTSVTSIQQKRDQFLQRVKAEEKYENWRNFQLSLSGDEIMNILQIDEGKNVGKIKEKLTARIVEGIIKNNVTECKNYLLSHNLI